MNRYACTTASGGRRFTTAFIAEYDPLSRHLIYVNAGHNNPMCGGKRERLNGWTRVACRWACWKTRL